MSKQLLSSFKNKQLLEDEVVIELDALQHKTGIDIKGMLEECAKEQRIICARKYKMQHIDTVGTRSVEQDILNAEFPNRWMQRRFKSE